MANRLLWSAVLAVSVAQGSGQGLVDFANFLRYWSAPPIVDAPFYDLQGTLLAGTNYLAELYGGKTAVDLEPVGDPAVFYKDGYVIGGGRSISSVTPGTSAWVQLRAWEAAGGSTFEEAALSGHWAGVSTVLFLPRTGDQGAGVPTPPAELVGIRYPGKPVIVRPAQMDGLDMQGKARLSVIAVSGVVQSYQWYAGASGDTNAPVTGATNATYTLPAGPANATCWVRISNSAGWTDSESVTVADHWLDVSRIEGHPAFTVYGVLNTPYGIDYTTNVAQTNWTPLLELTLHQSPITFIDHQDTNAPMRFYRIRQLNSPP